MNQKEYESQIQAQQAGFTVIRTFNLKFQDALGMTPHEFRQLIETGRENIKQ